MMCECVVLCNLQQEHIMFLFGVDKDIHVSADFIFLIFKAFHYVLLFLQKP